MNYPCINTGIFCDVFFLKNKLTIALATSLLLLVCVAPYAIAQVDSQVGKESPTERKEGWQLETAEPPTLELAPVTETVNTELKAVDTELKTVDTELKAVNTELKAVNTELKADASIPHAVASDNSELRIIENQANRAAQLSLNIEPQLKADLDAQYQRLQETLETADAFSESLGEDYLSYGLLLKRARRYDDAREVLIDAAHINKINNGLNAIEQRPYLAALFDIYLLQGDTEAADKSIKRIIWLEKQHPTVIDDLTYPLALRIGGHYMEQFLVRPVAGEASINNLSQADRYFTYVLNRYGRRPISDLKLPYGELALVNYWKSKIAPVAVESSFADRSRRFDRGLRNSRFNNLTSESTGTQSLYRAEFYLKRYLARTLEEGTPQMTVNALLQLGDINLMFQRRLIASEYYKRAWLEAQKLDTPMLDVFEQPVALPDFDYAYERQPFVKGNQALLVAMTFDVDQFGRVGAIKPIAQSNKNFPYFGKAKRALKKITYRPIIRDGKLVATANYNDDILVQIKELIPATDIPSPELSEPSANTQEPSANTQEPSANTQESSANTQESSANDDTNVDTKAPTT